MYVEEQQHTVAGRLTGKRKDVRGIKVDTKHLPTTLSHLGMVQHNATLLLRWDALACTILAENASICTSES